MKHWLTCSNTSMLTSHTVKLFWKCVSLFWIIVWPRHNIWMRQWHFGSLQWESQRWIILQRYNLKIYLWSFVLAMAVSPKNTSTLSSWRLHKSVHLLIPLTLSKKLFKLLNSPFRSFKQKLKMKINLNKRKKSPKDRMLRQIQRARVEVMIAKILIIQMTPLFMRKNWTFFISHISSFGK